MKFRKKPVVIEATPVEFILATSKLDKALLPDWIQEAVREQDLRIYQEVVVVRTINGNSRGEAEDWLLQDASGQLCICKPDIFLKTYEQVTE